MPSSVARRMSANPARSERSRFRLPRQGWEAKPWGQREQFRQREEQRLEGGEEASHQEADHHREGMWAVPAPANRPGLSRASSWLGVGKSRCNSGSKLAFPDLAPRW